MQRGLSLREQPYLCCDQALFKEFLLVDISFFPCLYLLGEGKDLKKLNDVPPIIPERGIMKDSLNGVSALAHSSLAGVDEQGPVGSRGMETADIKSHITMMIIYAQILGHLNPDRRGANQEKSEKGSWFGIVVLLAACCWVCEAKETNAVGSKDSFYARLWGFNPFLCRIVFVLLSGGTTYNNNKKMNTVCLVSILL